MNAVSHWWNLPEMDAERCVHSRLETASCQRCVDSCPRQAWVIDDEQLGIDESACDGCQLCAAACPESAISFIQNYSVYQWRGKDSVLLNSSRRPPTKHTADIPYAGSISLHRLVAWYRQGVRQLLLCSAAGAASSSDAAGQFQQNLEGLQQLLVQRGLPGIAVHNVSGKELDSLLRSSELGSNAGPHYGRRRFMQSLIASSIETGLTLKGQLDADSAVGQLAGQLLPRSKPEDMGFFSIDIDAQHCSGCDACAQVCPHQAIRLDKDSKEYLLDSDNCSGCRLCEDVCSSSAVRIGGWQAQLQQRLALDFSRCTACGADFHVPAGQADPGSLCPICQQRDHSRVLFQVLTP